LIAWYTRVVSSSTGMPNSSSSARAFGVLAQGGGALARSGVQPHQVTVGRLMQWVERQPAPGVGNGRLVCPLVAVAAHQSLEGRGQLPAQPLGLEELPVVKVGAIAQREAGQKVPTVRRFPRRSQRPSRVGRLLS
jgi:hypothetical protein